ncbi:hypothetical protein [Noviherbaspirillum pedocola]|uniref:Uncharacterized protein n=1 Tax=Noviherbaspirillum pedocola TaxID=2801341 RepID=A0A934SWA6_9BURK|nr:hypothetical protein [Noviherbaspirillum pedocola]MBK4736578.1 hypothetical protein [Noviherbaspirillum pedocola]
MSSLFASSEELSRISVCIREVGARISEQQEKVDRASSAGRFAYEERGVLFVMAEFLEVLKRRRARILRNAEHA